MAIPTLITELSTTAAANSPAGSDSPSTLDDIQRAHASFIAQLRDADALKLDAAAVSAFGLTLIDDASAAAARTTLGVTPANIGAASSGANTDITSLGSIASINGGQLAGMRNLLINGNLAINQRAYVSGTATGAANQYTLDRWRVVTSGQALTFTASGNGNSMTAPAGGVEQVIEGANIGGGTYVLGWTGTATATVNGTARAKGEAFTLPANTNATVRLIGGTASLVQLEPGGTVTPFEHRSVGVELALCQRYYCKTFSENTVPSNGGTTTVLSTFVGANLCATLRPTSTPGAATDTSTITNGNSFSMAKFPVSMRASPTITGYGNSAGNWYVQGTGATAGAWAAMTPVNVSTTSFMASFGAIIVSDGVATVIGHFTASAEL